MAHEVTLIPGDGTGPELTEATRRVLEATGVEFDWDVQQAGADVMDQFGGNPLPEPTLESIRRTSVTSLAMRFRLRGAGIPGIGLRAVGSALMLRRTVSTVPAPCRATSSRPQGPARSSASCVT